MNTACAGNDESLSRDTFGSGPQLWTAEAREKGYGRHQVVSTADIQVVGLTFENSKKYLLGEGVSGQETLRRE